MDIINKVYAYRKYLIAMTDRWWLLAFFTTSLQSFKSLVVFSDCFALFQDIISSFQMSDDIF